MNKKKLQIYLLLPIVLLLFTATGCFTKKEKTINFSENISDIKLYQLATNAIENEKFEEGLSLLKSIEARFPFGNIAKQVQLDMLYVYYKMDDLNIVKSASDRFIRLHPNHTNIDYALYMKGLAVSNVQLSETLQKFFPIYRHNVDIQDLYEAYNIFQELIDKYPHSSYLNDARQRMLDIKLRLAKNKLNIANYYMRREAYAAAANRAAELFDQFQKTPYTMDALAIMIDSYTKLKLSDLSSKALSILKINFPNSKYFNKNGKYLGYKIMDSSTSFFSLFK